MPVKKVGILIEAKDLTSKVLGKIGKGSIKAGKGVAVLGRSFARTSLSLEKMAARWGMITGLISAGTDAIRRLAVGHVDAAMEFRRSTDPMRKWYENQQKSIQLVSARIGDVWLPVLKGLQQAVEEATGSISDWIAANRELFATKIVEYFRPLSKIFIGIVKMVGLVRMGIIGLQVVMLAAKQAWWVAVSAMTAGAHKVLGGLAHIASALGQDDWLPGIWDAQGALVQMGRAADESADDAVDAMMALQGSIEGIQASTDAAVAGIERVTTRAIVLSKAAIAADKAAGETRVQTELAASDAIEKRRAMLYAKLRLQVRLLAGEEMRLSDETAERYGQTASEMSQAFGAAFGSAIAQAKSLEDVQQALVKTILSSTLSSVRTVIMAYAAEAAAAAFKGQAGIPVIGIALGTAAAATAFGIGQSFIQRMALGGDVRGGVPGRDSVPIIAMPGERVLTPTQTRRMDERERNEPQGAPMNLVVNVTQQSLVPDTEMAQRAVLALGPAMEQAARDGQLRMAT